jgi:hypothetical protein
MQVWKFITSFKFIAAMWLAFTILNLFEQNWSVAMFQGLLALYAWMLSRTSEYY